ncbi:MAG: PPOX class F420-dependent oxidoreductase [Acidimicrobiia bacterium]|nr:PPOX class F420-dependent oxidoreductase [Acidimicrobiia bacterium]
MDLSAALDFAARYRTGVLITIRSDGRPQSSDVAYAVMDGIIKISVTDGRAKTTNMRRDPRAVLHVTQPDSWSYVSIDCDVELSEVSTEPGDATGQELAAQFEAVTGSPHENWDEFFVAMVTDERLVVRLTPRSVVGQVNN